MMTLSDASLMLDETTDQLDKLDQTDQSAGVALIDQWIGPLQETENTHELASLLEKLKAALQANPTNEGEIRELTAQLADDLSEFSTQAGSEGEMPSLMTGLASAIRKAGGVSIGS